MGMKLLVLVDNNSFIGDYLLAEPGLSFYIEEGQEKILFDLGYSRAFYLNALRLNIDLGQCTTLAISHGHIDHTGGLDEFIKMVWSRDEKERPRPRLILHPDIIDNKGKEKREEPGLNIGGSALEKTFNIQASREPVWITERLVFLGEIKRQFAFEGKKEVKKAGRGKELVNYLPEDSALAYKSGEGLVIITGCSHAGICNIVEQARAVTGEERVLDIIGGLHLQQPSREQLEGTRQYIKDLGLEAFHPCHCTDLYSKIELSRELKIQEVGTGFILNNYS